MYMTNSNEILKNLPILFCALFVAILFIQSGLDKVFDWKGNLGWLTGHFSKTFVAGMVPMMLVTITEVIVTVENPATIIFGRIAFSMAATSSADSPAPLAASWDRIIVPGNPYREVSPIAIDIGTL